jgi:hypothetical protein
MNSNKRTITAEEERDLVASTERGEWRSVGKIDQRRERLRAIAQSKLEQINVDLIRKAIKERRMLLAMYRGGERSIEPYILGHDIHGKLVMSAVQRSGGGGVGFRSFDVGALSNVFLSDERFYESHPDYNPNDPYFKKLVARFKDIVEKAAA